MGLSYDPAITHLGNYQKELKTYVCTKTYTWLSIAVLFIVAKKMEAAKMSFSRWIDTLTVVYPANGILFSNLNKKSYHIFKKAEKAQRKL